MADMLNEQGLHAVRLLRLAQGYLQLFVLLEDLFLVTAASEIAPEEQCDNGDQQYDDSRQPVQPCPDDLLLCLIHLHLGIHLVHVLMDEIGIQRVDGIDLALQLSDDHILVTPQLIELDKHVEMPHVLRVERFVLYQADCLFVVAGEYSIDGLKDTVVLVVLQFVGCLIGIVFFLQPEE